MPQNNSLIPRIDINYKPLPGWTTTMPTSNNVATLTYSGLNSPINLGKRQNFRYATFTAVGLSRSAGIVPNLQYDPTNWTPIFGNWAEAIYPTSWAESNANFLVVNAYDSAGITFGFIQLAAHTQEDLLSFMKLLLKRIPNECQFWFPELTLKSNRVAFQKGADFRYIDTWTPTTDGAPHANYHCGLFSEFFNPSRVKVDREEIESAARWVAWTIQSPAMRQLQVEFSIENMKQSARKLQKRMMRKGSPSLQKYPQGLNGLRADYFAAAVAVPHLRPRDAYLDMAISCLMSNDILGNFAIIEYGPGYREKNVIDGIKNRSPILENLNYDLSRDNFF